MDNLLQMFESTHHPMLQQVGWTRLAKEISNFAHFEHSIQEFQKPPKSKNKDEIEQSYKILNHYRHSVEVGEFLRYNNEQKKIISTVTFSDYQQKLEKKDIYTIKELNIFILFFEVAQSTPANIKKLYLKFETFEEAKKTLTKELVKEFRSFVDYTGHADFLLHPVIGPLVKQLNDHEKRTSELVLEQVRKLSEEGKLQFSGFDIINGHYVVPYKTDRYSSSLGSIIHRSDSGSTLYIELRAFEEHSKKRNYLKEAIEFEIFNLEKAYSKSLKKYSELIFHSLKIVVDNDIYFSKALWANNFGGCTPEIVNQKLIIMEDFFHPSIENAVKNKFTMDEEESVLLISGPNTGGKSIILKAICINYLLMYAGLPIAASAAKLYPYQEIFYLATDGQDLDQGLSSFAAESQKIIKILGKIHRKSLMLVDEIFNSTSSEEASVIAYSVMNYWSKQQLGHAIFTSHHQTLKSWVHENEQMTSAHVGFDAASGAPTYVLHLGIPGSSHAIEIFEKFLQKSPLKDDLIYEIEKKKNSSINYEELIRNIQKREGEVQREISAEKQECLRIKSELNAQLVDLARKKTDDYDKFTNQLEALKKKAQGVVFSINQTPKKNIRNIVENEFWSISKEAEKLIETPPKESNNKPINLDPVKELKIGHKYYSSQWKLIVELVSISQNAQMAEVMMGNIKTRVKCNELFESHQISKKAFVSSIERTSVASAFLDARGMRLEEFQTKVESHLSFVISGDIPYLEIIHGHGDGILKNWLWSYLKENNKLYKYEVPDLSYGGVTKVTLI